MLVKSTLVRALTPEQEADRVLHVSAQPTHTALGFGTSPGPDPLSMHYDRVPALPGTSASSVEDWAAASLSADKRHPDPQRHNGVLLRVAIHLWCNIFHNFLWIFYILIEVIFDSLAFYAHANHTFWYKKASKKYLP